MDADYIPGDANADADPAAPTEIQMSDIQGAVLAEVGIESSGDTIDHESIDHHPSEEADLMAASLAQALIPSLVVNETTDGVVVTHVIPEISMLATTTLVETSTEQQPTPIDSNYKEIEFQTSIPLAATRYEFSDESESEAELVILPIKPLGAKPSPPRKMTLFEMNKLARKTAEIQAKQRRAQEHDEKKEEIEQRKRKREEKKLAFQKKVYENQKLLAQALGKDFPEEGDDENDPAKKSKPDAENVLFLLRLGRASS